MLCTSGKRSDPMRIKLGTQMLLSHIAKASGSRLLTGLDATVSYLTTDTRELSEGDLFIAIPGNRYDGENYVKEAKERGAFVLSKNENSADIYNPDTKRSLLTLADYYVKNLPIILYRIGITGSVGKTTTKEFLKILLSKTYKCHASEGNFNNEIGMPLSMLSAPPETQVLIMEMGMNHEGEIGKLSRCLKPNIAIITNVGTSHIGNLGSRENIAKAKLEICEGMCRGITLVPNDEPLLKAAKGRKTFSLSEGGSDYSISKSQDGSISIFKADKLYCKTTFAPEGEHHKICLASAVSAAIEVGVSPSELAAGVCSISKDNTRQNVFYREKYHFFTDFYNASFESVLALLSIAENYKTNCKKSLLLGDLAELGEMSEKIHFNIGRAISPTTFSNLFLFGRECDATLRGAIDGGFPEERIFINRNLSDHTFTANQIRQTCREGEIIFMKASRNVRLERILKCFLKKGEKDE